MKKSNLLLVAVVILMGAAALTWNSEKTINATDPPQSLVQEQVAQATKLGLSTPSTVTPSTNQQVAPLPSVADKALRPQMDGSMEAQRIVEQAYTCWSLTRTITSPNATEQMKSQGLKSIQERCGTSALSIEALFNEMLLQALAGNSRALARFATDPPLNDPDPIVRAQLEKIFAAQLPIALSRLAASGDILAMRLQAEYFSGCEIQLTGSSFYTASPAWKANPEESLRLLQRAREVAGPAFLYAEFEQRLVANPGGSPAEVCPRRIARPWRS